MCQVNIARLVVLCQVNRIMPDDNALYSDTAQLYMDVSLNLNAFHRWHAKKARVFIRFNFKI